MRSHDRSNDDRRPRKHKERESSTSNRKSRRQSRSESPSHKRRRDDESKEESLLRKAREYVEEHEKRNAKKAHNDDSRKKHRRHGSRERKDERKDREKSHATEKHRSHERHRQSEKSEHRRDRKEKDNNESDLEERKHKHHRDHKEKRHRKEEKREEEGRGKKKRHKSSGKEKGKSTKSPDKSMLYPLGPLRGSPPDASLDEEADYFEYHQHLRLYLYREKGAYFEDLTADEARSAFSKFVRQYNEGSIEEGYYDPKGPPAPALEQCKRTRHAWGFKTNEMDKKHLELLREGVRKQTEYSVSGQEASSASTSHPRPGVAVRPTSSLNASNASASTATGENRRKSKEEIMAERVQNKRLREHVRTTHDELTGGRKEGHERQREKRQELATKIHGAARDREAAAGAVELDDAALYGDDGRSSFQNALAREKQRESRRKEQKTARLTELQQKEKDKQADMLQMLGLSNIQPGQKITIAPRKDT